ncbi:MAG: hypothetical protein HGB12_14380, partial [Bacteroidetes bacterium]|nr:hypothetical protein [Bacteroidota bacterium]
MKKKLPYALCLFLTFNFITLQTFHSFSQGAAINPTGAAAKASAMLDVNASNQGILIPRLSTISRNAIPSPAAGLLIYNTNTKLFNYYNDDDDKWYEIGATLVSGLSTGTIHPGGGVSLNSTGIPADSSAMLDVSDNIRGILFPRIPTTDNIITPDTGLIIYNTSINRFTYYNGSAWIELCATSAVGVSGATGSQSSEGGAINTSGDAAHFSAMLDVSSSNTGMLIPRLYTTERNDIKAVVGLTIYNKDNNTIEYYNGSGWYKLEYDAPSITIQPTNPEAVCEGAGAPSFTVTATGADISYQWQEYISSWNDISTGGVYSGATSATLAITNPTADMNGYKYRCIVSGTCSPAVISDGSASLTVNTLPSPPTSVTPNSGVAICSGVSTNLNATSAGNTIYWYSVSTAGTIIGTSASATDYFVSPTTNTTYYAEAITTTGCRSATRTATALVTVNVIPTASPAAYHTETNQLTTNVRFTWTTPVDADGVNIYKASDGTLLQSGNIAQYYDYTTTANTQVGIKLKAYKVNTACENASFGAEAYAYSSANNPVYISFSGIVQNSIIATANGIFPNQSAGFSGVYIRNSTNSTNSGNMTSTTSWANSSLVTGTSYSYYAKAFNGDGDATNEIGPTDQICPTIYYSKSGTTTLTTLSQWGPNTDGSGTSPGNFTSDNVYYNIRNRTTATITVAWTVSGTNSKIVVGDGNNACSFTPATYTLSTPAIDVSNSATLKLGGSNRINDACALNINGIFDLAGYSETVGSLAGSGIVTSSGTGNLTLTA